MDYVVWQQRETDESLAWIRDFPAEIVSSKWKLGEGVSCADWFPENPDVQVCLEQGVKLADAILNYSTLLLVSERLKSILDEYSEAVFEYFPVTILDKKGRSVKRPYYVANLVDVVDCVDMEKSSYVMDSMDEGQVYYFKELILDESKIPEGKAIFRLKDKTDLIIINDPLSDAILDAGCDGAFFQDLDDHGSVHRD